MQGIRVDWVVVQAKSACVQAREMIELTLPYFNDRVCNDIAPSAKKA
jgi:hypothetical protein